MKKKSMDDPIKKKWREAERRFIHKNKHYLIGEPSDWKAVFFPGKDAGIVPTEIEVFEREGIKRSNMIGLERDKNVYKKLKSRKLGINLELTDAYDFFKNPIDEKIDLIMLDYESPLTKKVLDTVRYIPNKQILPEKMIFGINLLGRRERDIDKMILYSTLIRDPSDYGISDEEYDLASSKVSEVIEEDNYRNRCPFIAAELGYDELGELRKKAISLRTTELFSRGTDTVSMNPLLKKNPLARDIEDKFIEGYINVYKKLKKAVKSHSDKLSELTPEFFKEELNFPGEDFSPASVGRHQDYLMEYLLDKGYNKSMSEFLTFMLTKALAYPYFPRSMETYKYVSSNGSPMLSDFYVFDQCRFLFDKYEKMAESVYVDMEHISDRFSSSEEFKKWKNGLIKDHDLFINISKLCLGNNFNDRIFLGSSSGRPKLDGRTYYEHRKESVKEGQDKEELWKSLKEEFRTNINQLRAYERHFKMETYGSKHIEKAVEEKDPVEKIYTMADIFSSNNPYGFIDRLPRDTESRLKNFLDEDLQTKINLTPEQKNQLVDNIANSKWYKIAEKEGANESQIYRFFDDIMLYCLWNEGIPDKDTIKNLLYNSLSEEDILPERLPKDYAPEIKKGGEDMSPRGRPYISKDAVLTLLAIGQDPSEIARGYSGFTAGQMRAFKAHLTMNTYNQEFTSDLAYELFGTCGLSTEDVRKVFPKESTKRIGAYKAWDTMRNRGE